MKTLEYHEAANIFPLDEEHIGELAEDIRKHGLEVMIKTLDGKIIDGRRRYLACQRAGVKPVFREVKVADPVAYVVSLNLHRRQLNPSQRAMCAARASEMQERLEKEAKERKSEGGKSAGKGRPKQDVEMSATTYPEPDSGKTRDKLGKAFDVSGRSVDKARKVIEDAVPELAQAVDEGRLSVSAAEEFAEAEPEVQREVAEKAKFSGGRYRKPKPAPEPIEEEDSGEIKVQGVGVIRAHEAINCLTRIPKNDQLRKRGFQIVTDWIRHNK
jgi:ParB-like chromosome segregation protein Spo0J